MSAKDASFKLTSGRSMPLVGFGTYLIRGDKLIYDVLDYALGAGYRSIDTATLYENEESIGRALRKLLPKYKLKREDIFITSKLSPSDQGEKAYEAVKNSLRKLDCDYIDLYLIHWPGTFGGVHSVDIRTLREQSWKALIKAVDRGYVKDIGVSNYTVKHLKELIGTGLAKPALNQVECHPKYRQVELKKFCDQEGIMLQAYSSLGGTSNEDLLNNNIVKHVATKLGRSPAQILLRWATQQNIAIIPKARSKHRIEENIDLNFTIPSDDMQTINKLEISKYSWDPVNVM